jgi:hypothetical protein
LPVRRFRSCHTNESTNEDLRRSCLRPKLPLWPTSKMAPSQARDFIP